MNKVIRYPNGNTVGVKDIRGGYLLFISKGVFTTTVELDKASLGLYDRILEIVKSTSVFDNLRYLISVQCLVGDYDLPN